MSDFETQLKWARYRMKTSEDGARSIFKYLLSNCQTESERIMVYEQWVAEYQLGGSAEGYADVLRMASHEFPQRDFGKQETSHQTASTGLDEVAEATRRTAAPHTYLFDAAAGLDGHTKTSSTIDSHTKTSSTMSTTSLTMSSTVSAQGCGDVTANTPLQQVGAGKQSAAANAAGDLEQQKQRRRVFARTGVKGRPQRVPAGASGDEPQAEADLERTDAATCASGDPNRIAPTSSGGSGDSQAPASPAKHRDLAAPAAIPLKRARSPPLELAPPRSDAPALRCAPAAEARGAPDPASSRPAAVASGEMPSAHAPRLQPATATLREDAGAAVPVPRAAADVRGAAQHAASVPDKENDLARIQRVTAAGAPDATCADVPRKMGTPGVRLRAQEPSHDVATAHLSNPTHSQELHRRDVQPAPCERQAASHEPSTMATTGRVPHEQPRLQAAALHKPAAAQPDARQQHRQPLPSAAVPTDAPPSSSQHAPFDSAARPSGRGEPSASRAQGDERRGAPRSEAPAPGGDERRSERSEREASAGRRPENRLVEDEHTVIIKGVKYRKLGIIGTGGSSQVFKVIGPKQQMFALKRINLHGVGKESRKGFFEEVALLQRLQGKPGIIQYVASEIFHEEKVMFVVLEYGEIDLSRLLLKKQRQWRDEGHTDPLRADPQFICSLWRDMLKAVNEAHKAKIIHTDLKPANFLMVEGVLKLIDFGIAKSCGNHTTSIQREGGPMGTVSYMSPEAVSGGVPGGPKRMARASDIWSLGCILYQIVYGHLPFGKIANQWSRMQAITNDAVPIEFPPLSNSDVLDILKRCFVRDPTRRITMEELLAHPYLQQEVTVPVMKDMLKAVCKRGCHLSDVESDYLCQELQSRRNAGSDITASALLDKWIRKQQDKAAAARAAQQPGSAAAPAPAVHQCDAATSAGAGPEQRVAGDSVPGIPERGPPLGAPRAQKTMAMESRGEDGSRGRDEEGSAVSGTVTRFASDAAREGRQGGVGSCGGRENVHARAAGPIAAPGTAADLAAVNVRPREAGGVAGGQRAPLRQQVACQGAGACQAVQAQPVKVPDAQSGKHYHDALKHHLHARRAAINRADEYHTHTIFDSQLGD